MREVVLDTETTGLKYEEGHKIVEIGCVEIYDCLPTGREFHVYLDPQREIAEEATRVHGIDASRIEGKPLFGAIAEDLLAFLGKVPLVIHNAAFDLSFLNGELRAIGRAPLDTEHVVDTIALARQKFPGERVSLDALCRRFAIDSTQRVLHGALLDARLLAQVYLELCGGRQHGIDLTVAATPRPRPRAVAPYRHEGGSLRVLAPSAAEVARHEALMERIAELSSQR